MLRRQPGAARAPKAHKQRTKRPPVPIVGIGASAGGLEALELFLSGVPANCAWAFVIVQHLDPTHKDSMVEILQHGSRLPVVRIKDRTKIKPGHVYIIPPNRDLSILRGALYLLEPSKPRGLRLPIDFFFRSLADDQRERSMGVILSGMGSDGALGVRAIKEVAGAVFVQDPATAKFSSMPQSAVDSGAADVIADARDLPAKIEAYLDHAPVYRESGAALADSGQNSLEKIFILLRTQTGHDFSQYKKNSICRRIERRMGLHQLKKPEDYVRYLQENPQEATLLFKELLIRVTNFFRDPPAWEQLKSEAIPALLAARPGGGTLRAWVPGCSTGEEAYSLAIVFREAVERTQPPAAYSLQIFATDLDKDAIDKARAAVFPLNIESDVSAARLRRFFVKEDREYRLCQEIRETIVFATHNLAMDPPFTKIDILSCRNLLIYLGADLQKKIVPLFHYSLKPSGILFLGSAETAGAATGLFAPLKGKTRIYRRLDTGHNTAVVDFPTAFGSKWRGLAKSPAPAPPSTVGNLQFSADHLFLQRYSPPGVIATPEGDIAYISGNTRKYLKPAAGKANWNLFAMVREGMGYALNDAFRKARRKKAAVTVEDTNVNSSGETQAVNILVEPLSEPEALRGMMLVVFSEAEARPKAAPSKEDKTVSQRGRLSATVRDVERYRRELTAAREETQLSQEELKSTNEELQSANEELQSTNEELTTSKEEMQSMNEELQTVNHELQAKVDSLSRAENDMKNLLDSTNIATLFLDDELNVRRFTAEISRIIKLIPGDLGRPITDIVTNLEYPEFVNDIHKVLRNLIAFESQVPSRDGRWFSVRIMPYRTWESRIDGVVITFSDITATKTLEAELRAIQARLEKRIALNEKEADSDEPTKNPR